MKVLPILFCVLLGICTACTKKSQSLSNTKKAKVTQSLGQFDCVPGTPFLQAPIRSTSKSGGFSKSSETNIHNYIFLDTTSLKFTKLLNSNQYLITGTFQFPEHNIDKYRYSAQTKCPTDSEESRWFLYMVIKEDTNGDEKLSYRDFMTLAISDAGGQGYTELISNIKYIYGKALQEGQDRLIVLYQKDNKKLMSVIDLTQGKVASTEDIPDLGADVE